MCQFRNDAWQYGNVELVQLVGSAVVGHGIHHGIAEYHLAVVVGGGVVVEHCFHVGVEATLHFGQVVDEGQGEFYLALWRFRLVLVAVEQQASRNLLLQ